ncbi:hypothetical protein D3C87_2116310 [compost metagenome]
MLELNAADGQHRRFICVQRPEALDHPRFKTIAEIGKARIREVTARLAAEGAEPPGCRVLKLVE